MFCRCILLAYARARTPDPTDYHCEGQSLQWL